MIDKHKITCHASGDRCHGCPHYHGKADECTYKDIIDFESLAFTAYCAGYESGNYDAVEGCYSPPSEYHEEWAEKRAELLTNLLPEPPE